MKVFQLSNEKLSEIKELSGVKADEKEKLIQNLIEKNLQTMFPSLEFIKSEFDIDNLRPDSVAFDNDRKSFVIIEYKNVKHKGVVDQGMSYYKLLQEKKESFVLLYHKIKGKVLDIEADVNWDESRVIFIAPEFTEHQKRASQSTSLPIELYTISKFEKGIILFNKIEDETELPSKEKIKPISIIRLSEYSEDEYLDGKYGNTEANPETKELFLKLKHKILDTFSDVESKQKKKYSGFYSKKDGSAICTIETSKDKLKLCYATSKKGLIPIDSFVRNMEETGHYGIGNYMSEIKTESDIEKSIPLIEKVYNLKVK